MVETQAERNGIGELITFVNIRAFGWQLSGAITRIQTLVEHFPSYTLLRYFTQKRFMPLHILHQASKVKSHGVVLLPEQTLESPIAESHQQDGNAQQHQQHFVQAHGASGKVFKQGGIVFHVRSFPKGMQVPR
ncbi:hypothetical protein [Pseudomonas sp. P116]|uniref:hypothetical protein n=1 Tax=Pseudomonas sp. P116 TaxID=2710581 RepID=UPI001CCB9127|nr:hypothetical protein [Pseudomonas sp. P116]